MLLERAKHYFYSEAINGFGLQIIFKRWEQNLF